MKPTRSETSKNFMETLDITLFTIKFKQSNRFGKFKTYFNVFIYQINDTFVFLVNFVDLTIVWQSMSEVVDKIFDEVILNVILLVTNIS